MSDLDIARQQRLPLSDAERELVKHARAHSRLDDTPATAAPPLSDRGDYRRQARAWKQVPGDWDPTRYD